MSYIQKSIKEWAILGRPGYAGKKKDLRRKELEKTFGENNWKIAHLINGELISKEEALEYFEESYLYFFRKNPEILDWLVLTAKEIYDTDISNIHSCCDYSIQETEAAHYHDIAIRRVIKKLGKEFKGDKYLQIRGTDSEGYILSTGLIPFIKPELILLPQIKGWWEKNSIEAFWQSNKVLAVKISKLLSMSKKMVAIVLRSDVNMGKGKFSTQAAHALVSLLSEQSIKWDLFENPVEIWTVKGETNLVSIFSQAKKMGVSSTLIRDAGKTQITPGTKTAVGLGPIYHAEFDQLMGSFDASPLESYGRQYSSFQNFTLVK
ncbi:MAG: peptidyl-tRNA hydrolase [Candidatus Thorarchaeota archaeon]